MSVYFSGRASAKEEDQQEKGEVRFYPFSDSAVLISLGMQETLEGVRRRPQVENAQEGTLGTSLLLAGFLGFSSTLSLTWWASSCVANRCHQAMTLPPSE